MEGISKKLSIRTFLSIYAISFILNSVFFVDWQKVSAAGNNDLTQIVAIIVDKDIYPSIQSDVQWYATQYIQGNEANTKAVVLPINTQTMKAVDIMKMLENMYFDGIQDQPSKLAGVVLIGNIPLPVIEDNGFMYPSIYPYVDFEDQQFVYDQNKNFFVPNDNPNGQAEVRHGMINFDTTTQYHDYFLKLKNYNQDPASYVAPKIWYDDFIGLKKYYVTENTNYYANANIFSEDIGYHRLNNLLLNTLKTQHNNSILDIGSDLSTGLQSSSAELQGYAQMITSESNVAKGSMAALSGTKTPTLVLSKTVSELIQGYDSLLSTKLLTTMKDNVQAAARRYTQDLSGKWIDDIDSHYTKIVQKDNRLLGDLTNGIQPFLIQMNTALESGLNQKIATEKYAMKYPLPLRYETVSYYLLSNTKKKIYQNFYFGLTGTLVNSIADTNIYRGTFQNLNSLTGVTVSNDEKSVGGSYHILSQQVEANRGYNLLNLPTELALRSGTKQDLLQEEHCSGIWILSNICIGSVSRNTTYGDNNGFTDIYGSGISHGAQESMTDFAVRIRGGASPINLDQATLTGSSGNVNSYKLLAANYQDAVSSIYDIAGSQRTATNQTNADSFAGIKQYASMIETEDQAGIISYPRATKIPSSIQDNAIDSNGIPYVSKEKLLYPSVDFFTIFHLPDGHRINSISPTITLDRQGTPNNSGHSDANIYTYKLIDTTQQNVSPTPEEINAMNLTTADRPIDSVRNVSFQGIGGDVVTFAYPDLYQVSVYKTVGNKLVLKSPNEILAAIKVYLQDKVTDYNAQLTGQRNTRTQYYNAHTDAFNFLATTDPQATPNRNYNLLPQDFFITQLTTSLDNLVSLYGAKYIYGNTLPSSSDEKLLLIAKLLYQQNIARPEKGIKTDVNDDIAEAQNTFNVNQKISDTTDTYLQSDNNQGAILTPTYNQTGYEVAYINSDGFDFVQTSDTPAFVKQIQDVQTQKTEAQNTANTITQQAQQSEIENEINAECSVDPSGSPLLFDIQTGKSPRLDAMKCRAKTTFKQPFKISVDFSSSLGPVALGAFKDIGNSLSGRVDQWHDFTADAASTNEASNQTTIQNASPTVQKKLYDIDNFISLQASSSSRFTDSTEPKQLTIGSSRDLGNLTVRLSSTGDVCLGIKDGTSVLTQNLCQNTATLSLKQSATLDFIAKNNKAGSAVINAKICIGSSSICIRKSQSVTVLAGPVAKINITTPTSIVMNGAQMPINITAQDAYDNPLGQTVEQYTISPSTGTINGETSLTINNFADASFIYQAPDTVAGNMPVVLTITGTNNNGVLISGTQNIIVAKGILNVSYLHQLVYSTNVNSVNRAMGYTLPNSNNDLVQEDVNNIAQLQETALPQISLLLQDRNGNKLDSVLAISSKNNLLTPGVVQDTTLQLSGTTQTQKTFQKQSNFLIKDGVADITFYPTLKAGREEMILNVPGLKPITLVFNVHPGNAQKVVVSLDQTTITPEIASGITYADIQLLDNRNNLVTQSGTINMGIIGPGQINGQDTLSLPRTGADVHVKLQAKNAGGNGYLFAYINGKPLTDQVPGYQQFFVQNTVLPTTGLNVMYLSLFGTDRGNQRGYFSDNNKKINELTEASNKLLTTTTELTDPTKLKQIQFTIDPNGEINNLTQKINTLRIESGEVISNIQDIGNIFIGNASEFSVQTVADTGGIANWAKDATAILYSPEATDSIVTGNSIVNKKLLVNGHEIIDFQNGSSDIGVQIQANGEESNGLSLYDVMWNDSKIGTLALYKKTHLIATADLSLQDNVKYASTQVFTQGSTNGPMGVGVYDTQSVFSKQGYQSIEDSSDPLLGIGFTSNFKNISYFAEGENVGKATLPYGSAFLINFGDPLVHRISDNIKVSKTEQDASIGKTIFSNPNKTILKTLSADFNNDGLKDILIAYTDGSISLLKNYGGTQPYRNMQDLMVIADSIKDIQVGDVNGDHFPDIIVQTNDNKVLVYQNRQGVLDVDGTTVCLDTNTDPGEINAQPDDLSQVRQLFFKDMDQDGVTDIVTNDLRGDIKIFYGGHDGQGNGNYLSTQTGICDANRYTRQQNHMQTVKRLGVKLRDDWLVTDQSLVHRKNMQLPDATTGDTEDVTGFDPDAPVQNTNESAYVGTDALSNAQSFNANISAYTATSSKDNAYVQNPTTDVPYYENSMTADQVMYLPISQLSGAAGSGDGVSIYKQYTDLNGGILLNNDKVLITTTILSLRNNNRLTYLDKLSGPRKIQKNENNEITSLLVTGTNANIIHAMTINQNIGSDYQLMLDNIILQSNETVSFSYVVSYQQPVLSTISVQDEDLSDQGKPLDGYPDIAIQTSDPCIKTRRVERNTHQSSQQFKAHQEVTDDIQQTANDYISGATADEQTQMNTTLQNISTTQPSNIQSLPGMSSLLENRSLKDLFTNGGMNINLNTNFIDQATAGVSKKIDEGLKGLCQGFSLGKKSCQGPPIPFNEAFLAPGEYHVFGCVPQLPSPLAPLFKRINGTLGRGLPIIAFPTTPFPDVFSLVTPRAFNGAGGIFPGASTSQFRLYVAPTLTMGLGIAICGGPYGVAMKVPKPFRDLGGNCIVFAIPGELSSCSNDTSNNDSPTSKGADETDPNIVNAANNGACTNPPSIGNTITFAQGNNYSTNNLGTSSPFQEISVSESGDTPLVPQGNFGGLIQIEQEPAIDTSTNTTTNTVDDLIAQDGFNLKAGATASLKILGSQAKGLVKCLIQDWFTRQIKYILNNITKMTIQVDLPDLTQVVQGFGTIKNLSATYKAVMAEDKAAGYIQPLTGAKSILSQAGVRNLSEKIGQNPFEAIQEMFKNVPLINIETKDINLKIPNLTSEELSTYTTYLKAWINKNGKIEQDWISVMDDIVGICSTQSMKDQIANMATIKDQIDQLQKQTDYDKQTLATLQDKVKQNETCINLTSLAKGQNFITFKQNSALLINAVKENIQVLEQYKAFPGQLYDRIHVTDRYLAEISSVTSNFVTTLTTRLDVNANRFSQYVDAITLIVGAIKTRQVIIDFSVNRSEKCSKCSNDNYGSFPCSLSNLCPALPIFKIPPFKIPDINLDLSHLELGIDILLPKFNFVPIQIPLPKLPDLPAPPSVEVNRDIMYKIKLSFVDDLNLNMPTIPVIPAPPQLPELPSFIPNINLQLPVLPPAPRIPKILPDITATLKVANFVGKVFCIVKGGIGLVAEKGVKAKVEQMTQRTRNVPIFDFFDLTTKYVDPPLQGFDIQMDAYTRLKYNFEGVYSLMDSLANTANDFVSKNIQTPIQKGTNLVTSGLNNNNINNGIQNIPNLNINGYLPSDDSGSLDYTTAYKTLTNGLLAFKQQAQTDDDKKLLSQIDDISRTINADGNVTPASKELYQAKAEADGIVDQTRKQINSIADQVKNYDTFIQGVDKNQIQLVKADDMQTSISSPLIKGNTTTQQLIAQQEAPMTSYLNLNKGLVAGYTKALDNSSPEELNMTSDTYKRSQKLLADLDQQIGAMSDTTTLQTTPSTSTEENSKLKTSNNLLATNTCTNCQGGVPENGYQQDLSSYVHGVFVDTGSGTGKTMVNVVNNNNFISNIGKNYLQTDMNNDHKDDILLRDANNVYIKYAEQNSEHLSLGGYQLTTHFTNYYVYQNHGGKRRIDSPDDLKAQSTDGYITIQDIKLKVWDRTQEVKNFRMEGQSFDTLQLAWENNGSLGENVSGYIIKFTHKVNNFLDKIQTFNFFGRSTMDTKYIIVLPNDTPYKTGLLSVDDISKKLIPGLMTGTILAVKYYSPNQDRITVSVNELPRKRSYAQIATLQQDPSQLSLSQRRLLSLYVRSSTRGNQIVAGDQALADTIAPVGEITLHRILTNEDVGTGDTQQGYINTTYALNAKRTDDVAVTKMSIEQNGQTIGIVTGSAQTGMISITPLFFTGATQQTFTFRAEDANNNIGKEVVNLTIDVPQITISTVDQIDKNTAEVIATLQHDMDEGLVSFQRARNNISQEITGTTEGVSGYSLSPHQTIITGGVFTFGDTLALYAPDGSQLGALDPDNGQITLTPARKNKITLKLDFLMHIPTIEVIDTTNNKELFQINLPGQKLGKITLLQGVPNYQLVALTQSQFGQFQGGNCIKNASDECVIYSNDKGTLYVPGIYGSILGGTYGFDATTNTVQYTITDENGSPIATIHVQIQPLIK